MPEHEKPRNIVDGNPTGGFSGAISPENLKTTSGERDNLFADSKRLFLKAALEPYLLRADTIKNVEDWLNLQRGENTNFNDGTSQLRKGNVTSYSVACACVSISRAPEQKRTEMLDLLMQVVGEESLVNTYKMLSAAIDKTYEVWARSGDDIVFHCVPKERPQQTGSSLFARYSLGEFGVVAPMEDVEYIEATASLRDGLLRTYKRQIAILSSVCINEDHMLGEIINSKFDKYLYSITSSLHDLHSILEVPINRLLINEERDNLRTFSSRTDRKSWDDNINNFFEELTSFA
jgi:hypothetical protein